MFDEIDMQYYERRASEARQRADRATNPTIATIHRDFADEYERKIGVLRSARPR